MKSFEEFYFTEDNNKYTVKRIDEYYKKNKNYKIYKNKMVCPECKNAILIYVSQAANRCSYLRRKPEEKHLDWCSYMYDYMSEKAIVEYIDTLTPKNVQDKLKSLLKFLYEENFNSNLNIKKNNKSVIPKNPFLIEQNRKREKKIKALKRKRLDKTWIDESIENDLMIFFGIVKLKVEKHISKKKHNYSCLKIKTKNMKGEWENTAEIYRGQTMDNIDENKEYYLVTIGNAKLARGCLKIETINRDAIIYEIINK